MKRVKPCNTGRRHTWKWLRNILVTEYKGNSGSIKKVGLFQCPHCGMQKHGGYYPSYEEQENDHS